MTFVSRQLMSHLIAACVMEQERLTLIYESVGENEPSEFDSNDIYLYGTLISSLRKSIDDEHYRLDFRGKSLVFILCCVPAYVSANRQQLSTSEREELKSIYSLLSQGGSRWPPFPE